VASFAPLTNIDGLYEFQVRTKVELRLRQSGIKVFSQDELNNIPGRPQFVVSVLSYKIKSLDSYSYSINTEVRQNVALVRNPTIHSDSVATWSSTINVGVSGTGPKRDQIRTFEETILNRTEEFINAYLKMNPVK
jgi:hypothetical protein